jgi:hypothetical protein
MLPPPRKLVSRLAGKSFPVLAFGSCHAARPSFFFRRMSEILTADLLALDTDGLKSRLSKLRRYL